METTAIRGKLINQNFFFWCLDVAVCQAANFKSMSVCESVWGCNGIDDQIYRSSQKAVNYLEKKAWDQMSTPGYKKYLGMATTV